MSPPPIARTARQEGVGGRNAEPSERIQKEASPAALLVQSRTQQKSFLFLLEEKIGRAHIRKSEENFFAGWRVPASGDGLASFVGCFPKMRSDFVQGVEQKNKNSSLASLFLVSRQDSNTKRGRGKVRFPRVGNCSKPRVVRERVAVWRRAT